MNVFTVRASQVALRLKSACHGRSLRRLEFDPWIGKLSSSRKWQPTLVFLPGKSHGQRSLVGCSPWGHRVRHHWAHTCNNPLFSSVQSLSCVRLFATPWTAARQASLSITNSQSLLKPMYIESVMPSNHLILCCPPLLLPSIFPSIRVFSSESVLCIRWPKYWSFSFSASP